MKRKHIYAYVLVIVIVCSVLAIVGAFWAWHEADENRFPSKIFDELTRLETEYGAADDIVDRDLGNLIPLSSWCGEIEFESESYKVFAYEFGSAEDAFEYFKNASGQENAVEQLCFFHQSTSMGRTEFIAYYDQMAYKVTGGRAVDFARFMTNFCADFPIDLVEEYYQNYGMRLK